MLSGKQATGSPLRIRRSPPQSNMTRSTSRDSSMPVVIRPAQTQATSQKRCSHSRTKFATSVIELSTAAGIYLRPQRRITFATQPSMQRKGHLHSPVTSMVISLLCVIVFYEAPRLRAIPSLVIANTSFPTTNAHDQLYVMRLMRACSDLLPRKSR